MKSHSSIIVLLLVFCGLPQCSDETPTPPNPTPGQGRYFTLLDETNSEIDPRSIQWIYAHDDGTLFVAANGVFVLRNGIIVKRYTIENSALLSDEVYRIAGGGDYVWFMHREGLTYLHEGILKPCGKVNDYLKLISDPEGWTYYLTSMTVEDDGFVCFAIQYCGLYRYNPNRDTLVLPDVDLEHSGAYPNYENLRHANGITYFVQSFRAPKSLKGYDTRNGEVFDVTYHNERCWGELCDPEDMAFRTDGTVYIPIRFSRPYYMFESAPILVQWKDHQIIARDTIDTNRYPDKMMHSPIRSLDMDAAGNLFMLCGGYLDAIWADGSYMDGEMLDEIRRNDFCESLGSKLMVRCGNDGRLYISSSAGLFISKQPIRP